MPKCSECIHEDVSFYKDPCYTCLSLYFNNGFPSYNKFEPKEEKENEEMSDNDERYCRNCQYEDLDINKEPCNSCIGAGFGSASHPNFVKKENTEMNNTEDKVNHPSHYTTGEIEVINYIRDKLGCEEFTGYCIGNVMKYISRWRHKDGKQDLEKAKVYLQWAIESAEKEGAEV